MLTGKGRIKRITLLYSFVLFYIVAALVWWYISLEKQNRDMAALREKNLESQQSLLTPDRYERALDSIHHTRIRNTAKYLAEGIAFLTLALTGALFVARSVRKQFRVQQQQQNFMMAVTHELKTPISVARLNLETMQKHQLDPEKQKKLITKTLQETARLNFLTSNILVSAQLEGGYASTREELNLSDLVRDCVQDFRNRFPDRDIEAAIEPETEIRGDALLLQLLVNNLLENAIKYSPRTKPILCQLRKETSGKVVLQIIDEGEGIPDHEKTRIFDKFYRVGNESTRRTPGTGLGLYLCKKIAGAHNADISVTNHLPNGSNFAVSFDTRP
ncbi:MAG: two-component sensor histidine kinase [Chitinophagaceae bacterium]|nr:two-component sensor histidine kinase [Chitinophagaceae bacterium]